MLPKIMIKKLKLQKQVMVAWALLLGLVFIAGCSSGPMPWNVSITKTTPASIQVDLVGISAGEKNKWEGYSMDQYWTEGDPRRAGAKKISMTLKMNEPWVIDETNPIWNDWFSRGATELAVIANLPGKFPPGSADPRLNFFPLDRKAWKAKNDKLEFEVQDTIVNPLTPQKIR
jgi:hypothetical protein